MAIEHVVNRLGQQFGERLPAPLRGMREELEGTVKSLLRDSLSRMDLLTRDEFDIQQTLLARTRARVDDLEQQLRQLEQQLTALEQPPRGVTLAAPPNRVYLLGTGLRVCRHVSCLRPQPCLSGPGISRGSRRSPPVLRIARPHPGGAAGNRRA